MDSKLAAATRQRSQCDKISPSGPPLEYAGPRSWPSSKKHTCLLIISLAALLPDFGSAIGIPALIPQAREWAIPVATVQHSLVGNLFTLGAGGIFVVALLTYFGRQPVLFWFLAIALGTAIWCAEARSFDSYLAARILNGFFATVAQSGGLIWIQDLFETEDHARKINIWSSGIIISPYLGPMVSSFVIWHLSWRWSFYIYVILCAVTLVAVLLVMQETWHDPSTESLSKSQNLVRARLSQLLGLEQWRARGRRSTLQKALLRPVLAFTKLPVLLLTIYMFLSFAWVVGVNATVGIFLEEMYGFGPRESGIFYMAGIIGVVAGWVLGHWLHDINVRFFGKRFGGKAPPETRLFVVYPASLLMVVALVILGLALQNHWHYMVLAVCYALQVVGILVATVGVNAYLLQAYPQEPGEVGACINFARAMGGFMATYVQLEWVARSGAARVFGVQAAIVSAALTAVTIVHVFGQRIRQAQQTR